MGAAGGGGGAARHAGLRLDTSRCVCLSRRAETNQYSPTSHESVLQIQHSRAEWFWDQADMEHITERACSAADVTIKFFGRELRAHKMILCTSSKYPEQAFQQGRLKVRRRSPRGRDGSMTNSRLRKGSTAFSSCLMTTPSRSTTC